jgi:hypothetical protein
VNLYQFVATAVAEKVSALTAATYLRRRAARADRARFDGVFARLGSLPPRRGRAVRLRTWAAAGPASIPPLSATRRTW